MSDRGWPVSQGFEIFTLFPEAVAGFLSAGLMGKAIAAGHLDVHTTSFRDYTTDKHRTVDDTPYGGGAGMLLKPEPVVAALRDVTAKRGQMHTVMLTPAAPTFDQDAARRLAKMPRIGLLCGRYEGFDDRVRDHVDECLSIGDFVLNGGEVAALVMVEAIARLHDGVLGNPDSVADESFAVAGADSGDVWLEPPHYTRPAVFAGKQVPEVLLGGNHQAIAHYRRVAAWRRTWNLRPELRPHRSLAKSQPVYWVMPTDPTDHPKLRADLAELGMTWLPGAFDAKRIRKRLIRKHGQAPRWIGLGSRTRESEEVPVASCGPALLDLLAAIGPLEAQTPLIFVFDPAIISVSNDEGILTTVADDSLRGCEQGWPAIVEAAISLSTDACRLTDSELAQCSRIYESSQPQVPTEQIFLYLSRVLTQLRQP
ncbi:MAG: tRNA (guanosine(37)-N1)-methyltransferase TrmD, partial [Nannocystaceae bacterium]